MIMRAKHKLTELSIKQAIKKVNSIEKTIKISDGGGMYLQIQPTAPSKIFNTFIIRD